MGLLGELLSSLCDAHVNDRATQSPANTGGYCLFAWLGGSLEKPKLSQKDALRLK